jgi:hypothetical protein
MAMLIAWQTVNAVRRQGSIRFSRAFLVVTPGITIKDRLQVLLPNDPNNYYRERELVPPDMLDTTPYAAANAWRSRRRAEHCCGAAARNYKRSKPKARCCGVPAAI